MKSKFREREAVKLIGSLIDVDDSGVVWRIGRQIEDGQVRKTKSRSIGSTNPVSDYRVIRLRIKDKYYWVLIHRLIWQYFRGNIPEDHEINHKNRIRNDNRLENLELVTHVQNVHLRKFDGRYSACRRQPIYSWSKEKSRRKSQWNPYSYTLLDKTLK